MDLNFLGKHVAKIFFKAFRGQFIIYGQGAGYFEGAHFFDKSQMGGHIFGKLPMGGHFFGTIFFQKLCENPRFGQK